jgi:DNA-binding NarL/FixJ family response regulator
MKKIKVLLVDDHAVVRMGPKYALSLFKDIELAGELSDGERAAELMKSSGADVALLDIRMPGKDGLSALGEMLAADPSAKVVMLTMSSMEEDVYAALNAGAKGYVLKDRNPENIVKAVRTVAEGGTFIPDDIKAIYKARSEEPELTPTEREAVGLLVQGLSNKAIAEKVGISEDGVKVRLKHAYEKLGVNDRAGAISVAIRRGIPRPAGVV